MITRFLVAVVLLGGGTLHARTLDPPPTTGRFSLLTYNVAGLPQAVSRRQPSAHMPLIAPLLNGYDLVLVQEDFAYSAALAAGALHPHRSSRSGGLPLGMGMGDGLTRFSSIPMTGHARVAWSRCHGTLSHGSDCLATKGFARARHTLGPGLEVDVYNLHMDAGWSDLDRQTRRAQVEQLLRDLAEHSAGRAVIVAGDTNLRLPRDTEALERLLAGAGLVDVCQALSCGQEARVDRVLYRSGGGVELRPARWWIDPAFVDPDGRPLSDHRPVAVDFLFGPEAGPSNARPQG
jgi:endonuclease/exonuclease/phosphatase family metal-dependent hydrolase